MLFILNRIPVNSTQITKLHPAPVGAYLTFAHTCLNILKKSNN